MENSGQSLDWFILGQNIHISLMSSAIFLHRACCNAFWDGLFSKGCVRCFFRMKEDVLVLQLVHQEYDPLNAVCVGRSIIVWTRGLLTETPWVLEDQHDEFTEEPSIWSHVSGFLRSDHYQNVFVLSVVDAFLTEVITIHPPHNTCYITYMYSHVIRVTSERSVIMFSELIIHALSY